MASGPSCGVYLIITEASLDLKCEWKNLAHCDMTFKININSQKKENIRNGFHRREVRVTSNVASEDQWKRNQWKRSKGTLTDGESIEDGSDNSEQQNRAQVVEEQSVRHEVPGVENDRGKHVEEERVRREWRDVDAAGEEYQKTDDDTDGNQQARLREDLVQFGSHVETWNSPAACKYVRSNWQGLSLGIDLSRLPSWLSSKLPIPCARPPLPPGESLKDGGSGAGKGVFRVISMVSRDFKEVWIPPATSPHRKRPRRRRDSLTSRGRPPAPQPYDCWPRRFSGQERIPAELGVPNRDGIIAGVWISISGGIYRSNCRLGRNSHSPNKALNYC